jgi:DNA uptake protein ComE-like DNA-binding protein
MRESAGATPQSLATTKLIELERLLREEIDDWDKEKCLLTLVGMVQHAHWRDVGLPRELHAVNVESVNVNTAEKNDMLKVLHGMDESNAKLVIQGRHYQSIDEVAAKVPALQEQMQAWQANGLVRVNGGPFWGKFEAVNINRAGLQDLVDYLPGMDHTQAALLIRNRPYDAFDDAAHKVPGLEHQLVEWREANVARLSGPAVTGRVGTSGQKADKASVADLRVLYEQLLFYDTVLERSGQMDAVSASRFIKENPGVGVGQVGGNLRDTKRDGPRMYMAGLSDDTKYPVVHMPCAQHVYKNIRGAQYKGKKALAPAYQQIFYDAIRYLAAIRKPLRDDDKATAISLHSTCFKSCSHAWMWAYRGYCMSVWCVRSAQSS